MKGALGGLLALVLLLLFAAPVLAAEKPVEMSTPLRILPLGDSLTYGLTYGEPEFYSGYRGILEQKLADAHVPVVFVGTQKDEWGRQHEGHNGWRIHQIDDIIPRVLNETKPDVILLMVGTNDLVQGWPQDMMRQHMEHALETLHQHAGQAKIYIASVLPVYTVACIPYDFSRISMLNSMIQQLVQKHAAHGEQVQFVYMFHDSKLVCGDMNDGIHPNKAGYEKMAGVWLRALVTTLPHGNNTP